MQLVNEKFWVIVSLMASRERPYHHGNLSRALLDAAAELVAEVGPSQVSLREIARRTGVSNAAPVHHFGDKAGLFTALAAEGFALLAAELAEARARSDDFGEVGVAYVRFALAHRAHFEVMFRPDLYHRDDPSIVEGNRLAAQHLYGPAAARIGGTKGREGREAGVAAWALMHGLATLLINGNLGADATADPEALARRIGHLAFSPR